MVKMLVPGLTGHLDQVGSDEFWFKNWQSHLLTSLPKERI
jgi:hypothetical protein